MASMHRVTKCAEYFEGEFVEFVFCKAAQSRHWERSAAVSNACSSSVIAEIEAIGS